jgi:protein TonB
MVALVLSPRVAESPEPADRRAAFAAWRRERLTGRVIALLVVALFHVLLLLLVLFARPPRKPAERAATVVRLIPLPPPPAAAPTPKPQVKAVVRPNATIVPKPIVVVPPRKDAPPALFKTELMEAVDISKLPSHKSEATATAEGTGGTGTAAGPGSATDGYGAQVGNGPHGEALYAAAWYREPTNAETAPFLPKHLPDLASADIMCRTIERWGVEDCQEIGETPRGTGLARAIRQAGWQFKVKPVRYGNKFEVGTWVRIRFTITRLPASDNAGAGG